ncbi:MAG: PAS domain S-box protein [Deltaproteobacteria bacterium]|nr:PAS domain S-box protein [Candidatus Zymogenaceae bacterium]
MAHERLSVLFITDIPEDIEHIQKACSEIPGTPLLLQTSPTCTEGIERLLEGRFDAVILNGGSPGEDRLDDLRDLVSKFPHIPMVYYGSDDREDHALAALDHGAVDYLLKRNVNRHTLMRAIRYTIGLTGGRERISMFRFEAILENAPLGIVCVDMDGVIVYQNRASRAIAIDETSENLPDSAVGTNIFSLPGVTRDEQGKHTLKALLNGTPFSPRVVSYLSTTDMTIMMEVSGKPLFSKAGSQIGAVIMIANVTDRAAVEAALRESELKYKVIADSVPVGIFIHVDGFIRYAGTEAMRMLGYDEEEDIVGRFILDYVHEDDRQIVMESSQARARGEDPPVGYEVRMIRQDGTLCPVLIYASRVSYMGEDAIQGVFIDISEKQGLEEDRRRYLERLMDSEERYRTLVETSTESIVVVQEKRIVFFNSRFRDNLGYSDDDLLGADFGVFIHPDELETVTSHYHRKIEGGEAPTHYEFRCVKKNDEVVIAEVSLSSIEWENKPAALCFLRDVTERHEAQKLLQESEERYRELVENIDDFVYIMSGTGDTIFVNKALEKMLGYTWDDFIRINYRDIMTPESLQIAEEMFKRQLVGEDVGTVEYRFRHKNGNVRVVEVRERFVWKDGRVVEVHGIGRDITERKKSEEALRESEEKYRNVVERANDGILIIRDTLLNYANPSMSRIIGYSTEELLDTPFADYVHPDDIALTSDRYHRRMQGEDVPVFYEISLVTKDGRTVHVEVNGGLIQYQGAAADLVFVRDITERVKAEEALRESEEKLRNIFESSQEVIFVTGLDGSISTINPAGERLLGYSREELLTMNSLDFYAEAAKREKAIELMSRYGYVKDFEIRIVTHGDTLLECLLNATAIRNREGKVVAFQGSLRDITERKLLELQLINSQRMEAVGQLAGGMAHNFNNLLAGIMGYAEFLLSKKSEDDPDFKALSTIHEGTLRASELTRQLLDIARGGDFIRKPLSLNNVVDRVMPLVSGTFQRSIVVDIHLEDDIALIEGDPGQLEQCLLNLCINARDAMPDGGTLTIETRENYLDEEFCRRHLDAHEGNYVILTVSDTGVGMSRDIQEHVFEPFFSTKEEKGGTGMGLATVYSTVRHHGGIITFYSERNQGTTFRLYFPVIEGTSVEVAKHVDVPDQTGHETILLVDDEAMVLEVWSDYLLEKGYEVYVAKEGVGAVDIFRRKSSTIDLVILDYVLPGISAHEVLKQLRAVNPDVTVVITSGYSENGQAGDILAEDVDGFIQKPTPLTVMHRKIRELMAWKKQTGGSE